MPSHHGVSTTPGERRQLHGERLHQCLDRAVDGRDARGPRHAGTGRDRAEQRDRAGRREVRQHRLDRGDVPPELGVERAAQCVEVQVGDRADALTAGEGDDQPVDRADRLGDRADRVVVATVCPMADQLGIGEGDVVQPSLAPPDDVHGRATCQ
jgi:hypothetical protein